jgi:NADPH-dependent glutamate synthase beta subunit-like oxidoreductase
MGVLDDIENMLLDLDVKIRYNALVGPVITIDKLFEDGYDAIFIGTGVWNPKSLNIKGETLGHVHYAIDYLKSPNSYRLGENVLVIGAGNVAMDAARTAKHHGASNVTVGYRKDFEDMTATKAEIKEAMTEKNRVQSSYYQQILSQYKADQALWETEFNQAVEDEIEKISQYKIVIPDQFKGIYNFLNNLGKGENK